MQEAGIQFSVNGENVSVTVKHNETLADVLRQKLGLTGTKVGCDKGSCGACTVIMNGKTVSSCLIPAVKADKSEIITIEGISVNGELDPLQKAFIEEGAVQCGFCTPGMVLTAKALLDKNPNPTVDEIKKAIAGNLCRCTGYESIIAAVRRAAKAL